MVQVQTLQGLATSFLEARSLLQDAASNEPSLRPFLKEAEASLDIFGALQARHEHKAEGRRLKTITALFLIDGSPEQMADWTNLFAQALTKNPDKLEELESAMHRSAHELARLIQSHPNEFGCLLPENNDWLSDVLATGVSTYIQGVSEQDATAPVQPAMAAPSTVSEEATLKHRLKTEAGFYLFGKPPGWYGDFHAVIQHNMNPKILRREEWNIPQQLLLEIVSYANCEIIVYLKDVRFYRKHEGKHESRQPKLSELIKTGTDEEPMYIKYRIIPDQGDASGRSTPLEYIFVTAHALGDEILGFVRRHPERAFHLFTELADGAPPYTFEKAQRGRLFVADAAQVERKEFGHRTVRTISDIKDREEFNYDPGSDN